MILWGMVTFILLMFNYILGWLFMLISFMLNDLG